MKTRFDLKAAALCLLLLPLAGCPGKPAEPEPVCKEYQGRVVVVNGACDVVVQLLNADFGVRWEIPGNPVDPVDNVVYITNLPANLRTAGTKVYFTDYTDGDSRHCQQLYYSLPDKAINAINLSDKICKGQ